MRSENKSVRSICYPSISHFIQIWQHRPADVSAQSAFWDRRADSFNQHKKDASSQVMRAKVVEYITSRCRCVQDGRMLDIGCAAGHYSLALAGAFSHVQGFDLSSKMIAHATANAAEANIANVDFKVLDWYAADLEALGWEQAFDFVLASRTPAISDKNGLDKMIRASKKHCLLVSAAAVSNSVQEKLMPLVDFDKKKARAGQAFYCAYNILWLMGYYPEVFYMDYGWETEHPLEDSLEMHLGFFDRAQALQPRQRDVLTSCLAKEAVNGMVYEKVRTRLAFVYWDVTLAAP